RVAQTLGFPCFVKPANLGSSVGISKVRDAAALPAAVDLAAGHDRKIVVERAVRGREIEVSVLGNDEPAASLPCEITYESEWYDYSTKYLEGQARVTVPAPVSPEITRQVRRRALQHTLSSRVGARAVTRARVSRSRPSCASGLTPVSGSALGPASRPSASRRVESPTLRFPPASSGAPGRGRTSPTCSS